MATGPESDRRGPGPRPGHRLSIRSAAECDDGWPEPTAGMVLHRVLASRPHLPAQRHGRRAARRLGPSALRHGRRPDPAHGRPTAVGPVGRHVPRRHPAADQPRSSGSTRAGWPCAASAPTCGPSGWPSTRPGAPPCGPSWPGTPAGWARSRDLHILRDVVTTRAPRSSTPTTCSTSGLGGRGPAWPRRWPTWPPNGAGPGGSSSTEQMMVLWDGPEFKPKASGRPTRSCRRCCTGPGTTSGARPAPPARTRRDANLHKLRIRLKDLRYGCETVALVDGGPAQQDGQGGRAAAEQARRPARRLLLDRLARGAGPRAPPTWPSPSTALVDDPAGRGRGRPARGGSAS